MTVFDDTNWVIKACINLFNRTALINGSASIKVQSSIVHRHDQRSILYGFI